MPEIQPIPAITGIGSAFGERTITNADIAQMLGRTPGAIDRLMQSTGAGVNTRYWVAEGNIGERTVTSDLAAEALSQAIEMSGIDPSTLVSLTVATGTPDFVGVSTAASVQHKLDLPTAIQTYDIVAACPGYVHNLEGAFAHLTSSLADPGPRAVIGAEILSPVLSPEEKTTMILFGDAAGATIVDLVEPDYGAPTEIGSASYTDGQYAAELCMLGGGSYAPPSQEIIDKNLQILHMNGPLVKEHAPPVMASLTKKALDKAGIPIEEVDLFVPHQANLGMINETVGLMHGLERITEYPSREVYCAAAEALGIPWEKVIFTIDKHANTSSASIPTAMDEAWEEGKLQRNQVVAIVSFGGGFNGAAIVMPMVGLPKR